MSFTNIIDVDMLLWLNQNIGPNETRTIYHQLPLFETPPQLSIDEKYLCSVPKIVIGINTSGTNFGYTSTIDHPTFTATRDWLNANGHIDMDKIIINGDRVINPFYLNNIYFDIGDQFPCAAAMGTHLKFKT